MVQFEWVSNFWRDSDTFGPLAKEIAELTFASDTVWVLPSSATRLKFRQSLVIADSKVASSVGSFQRQHQDPKHVASWHGSLALARHRHMFVSGLSQHVEKRGWPSDCTINWIEYFGQDLCEKLVDVKHNFSTHLCDARF